MKRLLLLALCAILSANADARTLYVNAKRPNNSGNGLSAKKAKKTIQAAINAAKKGDTILVYPGTYAQIQTNNKKITVKSVKGKLKTKIVATKQCIALDLSGKGSKRDKETWIKGGGTSSKITGFRCSPKNWRTAASPQYQLAAVAAGGRVSNCSFENFAPVEDGIYEGYGVWSWTSVYFRTTAWDWISYATGTSFSKCSFSGFHENASWYSQHYFTKCTFSNCLFKDNARIDFDMSKLTDCSISRPQNGQIGFYSSSLSRCKIASSGKASEDGHAVVNGSKCVNCLFDKVSSLSFGGTSLDNCTVCKTTGFSSDNGTFRNTILWNNQSPTRQIYVQGSPTEHGWTTTGGETIFDYKTAGSGNSFSNTFTDNRDPKFANPAKGDYRLKKGSPCINKGKLTKALKKLVGKKDLAGKKRVKGKAIDRGCYEY